MTTISIQFKDKNKVFKGKHYDYILHKEEEIPKNGDIIRMFDSNFDYVCYGTRVKITGMHHTTPDEKKKLSVIRYIKASLDE